MARRRRKSSSGTRIVRVGAPRAASPIIKVSAPRAPARRRGRRRRSGGSVGGFNTGGLVGHAMGGALFGFAVKSGYVAKLPAIPVIGRTGTAAILLHYFSKHGGGQLASKAAMAAAVLAGYQLGSEGHVTGDLVTSGDMDGFTTMGDDV